MPCRSRLPGLDWGSDRSEGNPALCEPGIRNGIEWIRARMTVAQSAKSPAREASALPIRRIGKATAGLLTGAILLAAGIGHARTKRVTWKPVQEALLKENNRPVKTWNVYQPTKDRQLALVQVSRDWFIFDLKKKRVYRAERRDFQARGDSLIGPTPDRHMPIVKIDDWDSHDVGPAQQISARIAATGNVLTIELPHTLAVY